MFKLLDTVVLKRDAPEAGLRRGDLGAIVELHSSDAFEVEFVAASGRTQPWSLFAPTMSGTSTITISLRFDRLNKQLASHR